MNRLFPMMVLLMSVFQLSQARGELMISFRDAGLVSGGTGSVDVLLRSSQATTLAGFSAKFQISAETTGGVLEFQSTNLQSNSERTFSSLDYSYAFLNKLQDGGFSAERQSNKRQIVASDFATENVAIAANTNYLLARLELQHDAPVATSGNFRISFLDDPGINLFADSLGNERSIDPISFQNFGTISITAVPEPSSLVTAGLVISGALFSWVRRKKNLLLDITR